MTTIAEHWTKVEYVPPDSARVWGWPRSSVVLILDNGAGVAVLSDSEGNDAGALEVLPPDGEGKVVKLPTIDLYSYDKPWPEDRP